MNVVNLSGKFLRGFRLLIAFTALGAAAQETNPPPTIGFGEGWRYWNRETAPMAGWKSLEYNDSVWTLGTAQLGYGDGDEATVTRLEPVPPHPVTAYFRKHFFLGSPAQFTKAQMRLIRDDGAVVYINGVEVVRDVMPGGEVGHNTLAAISAGDDENAPRTHLVNISNLLRHTNVIAVEVHQVAPSSTDMSFDLELRLSELPVEERAVVSIFATQPNTSEPLPNALVVPGEFTVLRWDPHLDQPLNVYMSYSGSAGSADYEPLPIEVLFPAGSNTVRIPVFPKTDGLVEGPESVVARFAPMPVEVHDPTSPNRPYIQNFSNYVAEVTIQDADTTNQPPPVIELLEPRNGEVYALGAPIVLSANATSPTGYIRQVDFYAGTNRIATSILRPELGSPVFHMFVWTNAPTGPHVLTAVGVLSSGTVVRSEPVFIKVGPVNDRPSIAIEAVNNLTSELNGAYDAGKFRVRRVSGPTNEPVLFSMHISGLAVNGIDYEAVSSVATIPSGAASVDLLVRGLGDNLREGLETAEFRLNEPGCGTGSFPGCYSIFGEGAVQIHIMDGPLTTNEAPNAIITFPAQDSVYDENQVVEFRAEGVDIEGQVVQMDLLWGNVVFATTNGPVIVGRTNFPPGEHQIHARARDNTGKVGWSLAVRIFVKTASSIRIDQPLDDAVIQVGQPIQIFATAIDPNGYIPRLEFFANHLLVGVSEPHFLVAPPPGTPIQHSIVWSNAPAGSYAVAAFGTDSKNRQISSPPIHILVTNTPRPGPVVGVITRLSDYPVSSGFEIATGMFEFYRIGATNEALQVFFDIGGSATPGEDYVSFNNYIVFAPGSTRTNIVVSALDDSFIEGVETVTVDLKPAPLGIDSQYPTHYVINPTNELATVAILDDESTNSEPRVVITRPANGSHFLTGVPISIEASAVDPAGYIPVVDFFAGDRLIGTSRIAFIVPPPPGTRLVHTIVWSNAPAGIHMIMARGQSNRRFAVESEPIQVIVGVEERLTIAVEAVDPVGWEALTNGFPDSAHFRISRVSGPLSQPVNVRFILTGSAMFGIDYQQIPNTVTLSSNEPSRIVAIAPIPDNLVEGNESVVLTLTNCTLVAPFTLHPFAPFPDCYDIAIGKHRAEVVIRDASVGSNQPPRVTITAPHDGAVFEQGERVHYRVEASDPDGRVVQINMLMDGRVIASTNTFILMNSTNPPVGEHTLLAIARDDDGATNVSQRVRILVRGTNDLAFFERQLPAGFTPGTPFTVRILARVPSGTQAWGAEDQPPQGWTVSSISDGGTFDSATGKVKFGHFLEPGTRTLSYVVRPPLAANGTVEFTGIGSLDGRIYPIRGQNTISTLASEFHPADRNEDRRIALAEVTGYAAAWKRGETWPKGPNPIPASYVTRAGLIWRQGEAYRFAATNPPPFCWVPLAGRGDVFLAASASAATRSVSGGTEPGTPRVVTLEVEPAASVTAYNVEERVPEGWTVQNITGDGVLDPVRRVVRWGLYLDSEERTLSYQLVPPEGVAAGGQLLGEVTLDGEVLTFDGADSVVSVDPATQLRLQSTQLTGDGSVQLKLGGAASQICILESSSDLVNWSFVAELFLPNGELEFRDSDAGEKQQRYYRLRAR